MAYSPPNAIPTVWQNIEPYLLLEDVVPVAQTCASLHSAIIDAGSRKVKVSHLEVVGADRSLPRFLPRALNCIHLPSLRRLRYPPKVGPGTRDVENYAEDKEAIRLCFPILAVSLYQCVNLECFFLNPDIMIQYDYDGQTLKHLFGVLGRNLGNCCKLKELTVINIAWGRSQRGDSLIRALTPAIAARKNKLKVLRFRFSDYDERNNFSEYASMNGKCIYRAFFAAVLSARKLESLNLTIFWSWNIARSLLGAAEMNTDNDSQMTELRNLKVDIHLEEKIGQNEMSPRVPFMMRFSDCCRLNEINLKIPAKFWEGTESLRAFAKLVENKPELRSLTLNFDNYMDHDYQVLKFMVDFAKDCKNNVRSVDHLEMRHLKAANVVYLRRLVQLLESVGLSLMDAICWNMDNSVDFRYCMENTIHVDILGLSR